MATTQILDRCDIYNRFKVISEMHTGTKQHNEARAFFVGYEYELNANNLNKGELQGNKYFPPKYFYSQKWLESGKRADKLTYDFPLVFLTAGDAKMTEPERRWSEYTFDLWVFDLMHYDRNNTAGNVTSGREKEDIWCDTEKIALEILEAFGDDTQTAIYNEVIGAQALGIPEDSTTWDAGQRAQYDEWYCAHFCGNYTTRTTSAIQTFSYDHNMRLAGVSVSFTVRLFTGCPEGTFNLPKC